MYFFVCSILKHQLNTDVLDEKMKMVLVFLMLLQGHQECGQFNIVSILLNILFKHNLKKLLNPLEFFLFNVRNTKTILKLQKGYENFLSYFELCGRGIKTF